jgi:predicted nucleic acid-binding protein
VRYWDASALVPLVVAEPASPALRRKASDQAIVTWCLSGIEIASAIERRARERALDGRARAEALGNVAQLAHAWTEVTAIAPVRERAQRLLATHPLRAGDAIQLAAALVAVGDRPGGHEFLSADLRLREAAAREGFEAASY